MKSVLNSLRTHQKATSFSLRVNEPKRMEILYVHVKYKSVIVDPATKNVNQSDHMENDSE